MLALGAMALFAGYIALAPATLDGVRWLRASSIDNPHLLNWIFETKHLQVGWRPLAALFYLLGDLTPSGLVTIRALPESLWV